MHNPYEELKTLTENCAEKVARTVDAGDWSQKMLYGNWLAQTYYYVSHSTRILALAASRFGIDRDDRHIQLINHAKEERSHEKIAERDLNFLGYSLEKFPELSSTKALYRGAYFMIEHVDPIALYGYVFLLELLSLHRGKEIMDIADHSFGHEAIRYLKLHTVDDVDHIQAYAGLLGGCTPEEQKVVAEAIITTADNYIQMLHEISACGRPQLKQAA